MADSTMGLYWGTICLSLESRYQSFKTESHVAPYRREKWALSRRESYRSSLVCGAFLVQSGSIVAYLKPYLLQSVRSERM